MKHFTFLIGLFVMDIVHTQMIRHHGNHNPPFQSAFPLQRYFDTYAIPSASQDPMSPILRHLSVHPEIAERFHQQYSDNISSIAKRCPPDGLFASFNPDHRAAVYELTELYSDKTDMESLLQFSAYTKSRPEIHPQLWYLAFMKAQVKFNPSAVNINRPCAIELFPSDYFPDVVIKPSASVNDNQPQLMANGMSRKKRQFNFFGFNPQPPTSAPQCVIVDEFVGQDNGVENALWYFREDIQLNAHHFLWHTIFPTSSNQRITRRGEIFYFFHHDILARYRTERLANGLAPVDPVPLFLTDGVVLSEGYNAHMASGLSTQTWVPRVANTPLNGNTLSSDMLTRMRNLATFRQRIIDITNTNSVVMNGMQSPLTLSDNINVVGELLEASIYSVNPNYYGQPGLHNDAHWVIANILNNYPPGSLGVMGHSATAMRDILFYRVHAGAETLFAGYKANLLPPYQPTAGDNQLVFPGITISSLSVSSVAGGSPPNVLGTFWSFQNFTLQGGLDFNPNGNSRAPNLNVCAKHLNHEEFTYSIQVNNARSQRTSAFVRIFMAPRYKSLTDQIRYTMDEQRSLFFAMDSFVMPLSSGVNTITRNSVDSSLTAPWPRSVQQVQADIANGNTGAVSCECGFPHHLLLPRGTPGGMVFDLFVHITDASTDYIPPSQQTTCIPSHIHCGIFGQQYPDAKPGGYPFDRRPYSIPTPGSPSQMVIVPNLETFVSNVPNMATTQVTIIHQDVIV